MNPNTNSEDPNLARALREARPHSELRPRFQEGVWRRIAEAESPVPSQPNATWLDAFAALVLRPRLALAAAVILVVAGTTFGARAATHSARQNAQARYIAAVAPNALR
jgi:hypothetical protein